MNPIDYARAYVTALTGSPDTPLQWRAIHDTDKGQPGHNFDGTLAALWPTFERYQASGWGIFVNFNELDGVGRELPNVRAIRAHAADLDGVDAQQQYDAAAAWHPAPSFAVSSSDGRWHIYWVLSARYNDNARYTALQRRLRQLFNADKSLVDATRVLRLPGTLNLKRDTPHLVTCHALAGYTTPTTVEALEAATASVQVIDGGGERHDLGDAALAAPTLAWLKRALELVDPNELDRPEWISLSAAVKQAGWTLTDEQTLRSMWDDWCARYSTVGRDGQPLTNDPAENTKAWNSIRNTELGWPTILRRVPSLRAQMAFGEGQAGAVPVPGVAPPMPTSEPPPMDCSGEMLTPQECAEWFKGCVFVGRFGKIMLPNGVLHGPTQFNAGDYSAKKFIITSDGKPTGEAWKAATQSTQWCIPKVEHLRFLPDEAPGAIVTDVLGRKGVNTYVRPDIRLTPGDPTPFLNHLAAIIPDEGDRRILLDWMAHVVRFPGFKIPWAPVIQSAEGIGKGVIKDVMAYAVGQPYVHFPNAQQLGESGGKFNGWMRGKVFILADEIKVDEKRHMVEVLKPLISERLIEVQSKGADQEMEDNPANWAFFSNWKDAIPVSRNGRRYAIFFSPIQTEQDLLARGMNDEYMKQMFAWLHGGGDAIAAHYLHNYPIERGAIPMRAPKTTSWDEAVAISRSPIERVVMEAVQAGAQGFAGGWVSEIAAMRRIRETGAVRGSVPPHAVRSVLEGMGYRDAGRQVRPYMQEDKDQMGVLYWIGEGAADVSAFGVAQGYEVAS